MTVLSPHATRADLARSVVVALLAIVQAVVALLAGGLIWQFAREHATPLLAADWAFFVWVPIYAGFLGYAAFQAMPGQWPRQVHRDTGWWLAASAVFNVGWVLTFKIGWLLLAELLIIGLLASMAVVFGRLTHRPAEGIVERVLLRGTVAIYTGWVSLATAMATAATGAWIGLPAAGALVAFAAVVVLLAVTAIVSWAVLVGTAVVPYAAAAVWAIMGVSLNEPPAGVVVAGAIAIVILVAATVRRITTTGYPMRAAWG